MRSKKFADVQPPTLGTGKHWEASLMGTLSDPNLEKFSQALLVNIAQGMPRSRAAAEAARAAGYSGKSDVATGQATQREVRSCK
jgi:hypothetical protein